MTTSTPKPSSYIHGTHADEQSRLSLLNDILNAGSLRELNLKPGDRVLDVACGLGQLTRAMARQAGQAIGVERSSEQLVEAMKLAEQADEPSLAEFRRGDATALPLREDEWGTFDVVHARFLLEHLPDPLIAVRQMVRAARPGGRIALEDDDHEILRLYPEPPGFGPLWAAYIRAYDRLGNDGYIGRRLVQLLHQAGARPTRNTWIFFGSCSGHPDFAPYVRNLAGVISTARDHMIAQSLVLEDDYERAMAELDEWGRRDDAAFWYAVCYTEAVAS